VVADIEIISERGDSAGWVFTAQVTDGAGNRRPHDVRLSWADYNLWSASGADEPAAVAVAVLRFLLAGLGAADLKRRFDASVTRRLLPGADEAIPRLIGRAG
jgi:hypothetical protein